MGAGAMMNWMLMPYRRYAEFDGRSRRREYWSFMLFYWLVIIALDVVFGFNQIIRGPGSMMVASQVMGMASLPNAIFGLASLIPQLAVSVRRLHDQDRSGWLLLLNFIPILGWSALFVLMCLEGTRGPNRFGPDPKRPYDMDAFG
jgi:uncharacterized membrane protein YhaH (DUF805 family)